MLYVETAKARFKLPDNCSEADLELIEEIRRFDARESFWEFRRLINPKLIVGWWQQEVANQLQQFYQDYIDGKRPKLLLQSPPQHGKQVADSTPVLTTKGWTTHGRLRVGDFVFHPSGRTVEVLALSEKTPSNVRVELSNGEIFYCHENHEWTLLKRCRINGRIGKRLVTVSTNGLLLGKLCESDGHSIYHLPKVTPLRGVKQRLPVAPYALGAWLGNGTRSAPRITQAVGDEAVVNAFEELGYLVSVKHMQSEYGIVHYNFCVPGHSLRPELKQLGFMRKDCKKFIPDQYLVAPLHERLELLAGLMDTDGYIYHKNGRAVFVTADKELKDSFVHLLATFGWHASVCNKAPRMSSGGIQGRKVCYYIGFSPTIAIPCRLERKKMRRVFDNTKPVAIKSVSHDDRGYNGHCIQVDAPDGLYLVGETMQPTHNSTQVVDFLAWLSGRLPDTKIIFGSFSDRLGIRANLRLQRIYDSETFRKTFPRMRLKTNAGAVMATRNREILEFIGYDGYFRNTTVMGAVTGEGLDIGVIDDPIKGRAEASSQILRDRTWDWLTDDFMTRFSDQAGLLLIMTRWHVDDPAGRIIENFPDARVLRYPAIAERNEKNRKAGEPLFPEFKSLEFLQQQRKPMTQAGWESVYQQHPIIVGGGMFPIDKIKVEKVRPVRSEVKASVRYWDKAGTEGAGAYTAGVLVDQLKGGSYLISDVRRGQWGAFERETRIKQTAQSDNADGWKVDTWVEQEPGSGGKESAQRTIMNLAGFNIHADRVKGNKELRAEPLSAQVQAGNVAVISAQWNRDFLDELETFPNGTYKDQVDAAGGAFAKLTRIERSQNLTGLGLPIFKDRDEYDVNNR